MNENLDSYPKGNNLNRIFFLTLKLISIIFFFILFTYHVKLINHPYPAELREGGDLLSIKAFSNNINPYALSSQPIYFNPYGIGYPLVAEQVTKIFGINVFSGRLLSAISIFISLFLVFLALRKENINKWHCFFGVLTLYSNLLFFVTPITRPDALGLVFFILSIIIPVLYRFSYTSLMIALVFSIVSFYIKQYFIIGYPILLLYLFMFKSIRKSIILFLWFAILFTISAVFVSKKFECFFYNTVIAHLLYANNDHRFAFHQLRVFIMTNLGFFLMLVSSFYFLIMSKNNNKSLINNIRSKLNISTDHLKNIFQNFNWNNGVVKSEMNFYTFLFCCVLLILMVKLGGNVGAYMTYFYQLLTFPFIMFVLALPGIKSKNIFFIFVLINFVTSGYRFISGNDYTEKDNEQWMKADSIVASTHNIFNTSEVAALIINHGAIPLNSGFTETFSKSTISKKINTAFPFTSRLNERNAIYLSEINQNIENKKFDRLILNEEYSSLNDSLLSSKYIVNDTIRLNFYHTKQKRTMIVWVPKL